jgi:hypothetical protein
LVKRGGSAYENVEDPTDVGGVVGATVGFRLGSALSFYVAADDYIYGSRFDAAAEGDETKTQNDVTARGRVRLPGRSLSPEFTVLVVADRVIRLRPGPLSSMAQGEFVRLVTGSSRRFCSERPRWRGPNSGHLGHLEVRSQAGP